MVVLSRREPLRLVALSTTYLGFLQDLHALDRVVGISCLDYITSPRIRNSVLDGEVLELAPLGGVDAELLLSLAPALVLQPEEVPSETASTTAHFASALPRMPIGEFLENHPLGRLEWIKVFGFLTGTGERADSIFSARVSVYTELAARLPHATPRPSVLVNAPYREQWYIPGRQSYLARLVRDAGGEIPLSQPYPDALSHVVNLERILALGSSSDFWLHPGMVSSLQELAAVSPLHDDFESVRNRRVYSNTARLNATGGNDFYESGVVHPELLLEDLLQILHPEYVDSSRRLFYYVKLK